MTPDYDKLDPGIRKVVELLNDNKFETTDSGDGVTKADLIASGDALGFPHVTITTFRHLLVSEADRLVRLLKANGVDISPVGRSDVWVQACYDPVDDTADIMLAGVNDGMLAR